MFVWGAAWNAFQTWWAPASRQHLQVFDKLLIIPYDIFRSSLPLSGKAWQHPVCTRKCRHRWACQHHNQHHLKPLNAVRCTLILYLLKLLHSRWQGGSALTAVFRLAIRSSSVNQALHVLLQHCSLFPAAGCTSSLQKCFNSLFSI